MLLDRLIDRVPDANVKAVFESAELIICDNVADYIFRVNPRENWDLAKDFPNVAPPFPRMFLEWAAPRRIMSKTYGDIRVPSDIKRYGLMVLSDEIESFDETLKWAKQRHQNWIARWLREAKGTGLPLRWMCLGQLLIEDSHGIGVVCEAIWGVAEDGLPIMPHDRLTAMVVKGLDDGSMISGWFFVPFLSLSFMHCKNVVFQEVAPPPRLQKARSKRGKRPLMTYHVLQVHPIRRILETEGEAQKIGLKRALHICRGHFKDFSVGKGLFGRIHGIYWWDAHIRGDKKEGIALKDYDIKGE